MRPFSRPRNLQFPETGYREADTPLRQGTQLAEGQKSTDVKQILAPPPLTAKTEKWRRGVRRPRKMHVFGVLVRQLAERVRENLVNNRQMLLTVARGVDQPRVGAGGAARDLPSAAEVPPGEQVTPLPARNLRFPPQVGEGTGGGFHGVGRYPGTLQHVVDELNAEGTDYLLLPDGPPETAGGAALATLRQLLSHSPAPLTRPPPGTLPHLWGEGGMPEPHPPRPDSLWRSLTRGCELGLLVRSGAGTKAEAFRYGLAEGGPAT